MLRPLAGDLPGVDGHVRGEAAEHAVLERRAHDRVLQTVLAHGVTVLQLPQVGAGPDGADGRVVHRHALGPLLPRRARRHPAYGDRRALAVAPVRAQRHPGEDRPEMGDRAGLDVELLDLQVGDQRRADPAVDVLHGRVEPVLRLDQLAPARAEPGQPAEEPGVHGPVDADRVHAHGRQRAARLLQDLVLVAHLAVGDQHHDAFAPALAVQQGDGLTQRFQQLGAAARVHPGQVLDRAVAVAVGRLRHPLERLLHHGVEGQHREPVLRRQRVDDARGGPPGAHHLPAAHAAGPVEQQHQVAWGARSLQRRREHGERERAPAVELQRRGGVERQPQHEVTVEPLTGTHAYGTGRLIGPAGLLLHDVQAGGQLAQLQTGGVHARGQRQPHRVGEAGQQHGRADPGGVGDRAGVGRRAVTGRRPVDRPAGDVARRHDQREPERGRAVLVRQRLAHRQRDPDALAWQDVAHPDREHVGPLLLGDGRPPALAQRLVVVGPGLAALLEHALDHPVVGLHPERGDGRAVGQREDVRGLQGDVERVPEPLRDLDPGDESRDVGGHVHALQRQVATLGQQRAEPGVRHRQAPRGLQRSDLHISSLSSSTASSGPAAASTA